MAGPPPGLGARGRRSRARGARQGQGSAEQPDSEVFQGPDASEHFFFRHPPPGRDPLGRQATRAQTEELGRVGWGRVDPHFSYLGADFTCQWLTIPRQSAAEGFRSPAASLTSPPPLAFTAPPGLPELRIPRGCLTSGLWPGVGGNGGEHGPGWGRNALLQGASGLPVAPNSPACSLPGDLDPHSAAQKSSDSSLCPKLRDPGKPNKARGEG